MSIQWTLVATFLYIEIALVIILLLPIISPKRWQQFFHSRFLRSIEGQINIYFAGFLCILVLLFLDSIRQMRRYSNVVISDYDHGNINSELNHSMKLFRAQRNFYIAGFSLFLCLVIRRLVSLISTTATLKSEIEAALKQAKSASETAEKLLDQMNSEKETWTKGDKGDEKSSEEKDEESSNIIRLKRELAEIKGNMVGLKEDLAKALLEKDIIKKQADSVAKEYDRLTDEHSKLTKELQILRGTTEGKKDD